MPALTHGRVINGFNQYARSITYARPNCPEKPTRDTCGGQKPFCCGNPIQPFKNNPGTYCGSGFCRIPTRTYGRKQAAATGIVGRSTMAKRAIYRRVANCQGSTTVEAAKTESVAKNLRPPAAARSLPAYDNFHAAQLPYNPSKHPFLSKIIPAFKIFVSATSP